MIRAVFFDFNGVIIDDEPLQLQAYQELLREQGIDLTAAHYYEALGMDDKAFVRAAFERAGKALSAEMLQATIEGKSQIHRRLIQDELPLFPGVVTFLKASARQYQLGLVSMARRQEIDYVLERARLRRCFEVIVSTEDVAHYKPDPECYQTGLAKLNASRAAARLLPLLPNECLAIEDSPPGIVAAKRAGMRTIGVTNTVPEADLRAVGAEIVTSSLADWTTTPVHLIFDK
jgi:beta-phosphoglucomutase